MKVKKALVFLPWLLIIATIFSVAAATPTKRTSQPILIVKLDRNVVTDPVYGFDSYLYVTNPSKKMDIVLVVDPENPKGLWRIQHTVKVNYLTVEVWDPNGVNLVEGWLCTPNWNSYRWDLFVYPGERSLVLFVGWGSKGDPAWEVPGYWRFKYTLNCEFEGEPLELVETFKILHLKKAEES